jgi:hypothetical protein
MGLLDRLGFSKPVPQQPNLGFNADNSGIFTDGAPYKIIATNWYTAKPYGFRVTMRDGREFTMFLPISPSNLRISTSFATNVIPTLYGTVEEHSPVRYYDIEISGNTGIAPKFVDIKPGVEGPTKQLEGRTAFAVSQGLSNIAGGFFTKTLGVLDRVFNQASELINGIPNPQSGVFIDQTGYLAFHNMYRLLLKYKEDASGTSNNTSQRTKHPLTFFNYKDNNEYDVVVKQFDLIRSAENPHLYNYVIRLRAYNLRTAGTTTVDQADLTKRLEDLGLNGVDSSSFLGDIKQKANQVKGILGPLGAGINILGR